MATMVILGIFALVTSDHPMERGGMNLRLRYVLVLLVPWFDGVWTEKLAQTSSGSRGFCQRSGYGYRKTSCCYAPLGEFRTLGLVAISRPAVLGGFSDVRKVAGILAA
ncbi:hypothetical protein U1Q18_037869 [Sarracenia purpurea var. burkii]